MANNNNTDLFSMSTILDALPKPHDPTASEPTREETPEVSMEDHDNDEALGFGSIAGLEFPVGIIAHHLKEGEYSEHVGDNAPVFLAAVLEYLAAEVLELAGYVAIAKNRTRITPNDIQYAMRNDEELHTLCRDKTIAAILRGVVAPSSDDDE